MRVDNGFTIYNYAGEKVFEKIDFGELYEAKWKPGMQMCALQIP